MIRLRARGKGRFNEIMMPSEIADGLPAGTNATAVKVYQLTEEELAAYRREDEELSRKELKDRVPELHARFDAGEGESYGSKKRLAQEFRCSPSTIYYEYSQWKKGRTPETHSITIQQEAPGTPPEVAEMPEQAPEPTPEPALQPEEALPVTQERTWPHDDSDAELDTVIAALKEMDALEQPAASPNLCESCIKRDVCPLAGHLDEPRRVVDLSSWLPEKLHSMRVVLSPRYVQECSAYHKG